MKNVNNIDWFTFFSEEELLGTESFVPGREACWSVKSRDCAKRNKEDEYISWPTPGLPRSDITYSKEQTPDSYPAAFLTSAHDVCLDSPVAMTWWGDCER